MRRPFQECSDHRVVRPAAEISDDPVAGIQIALANQALQAEQRLSRANIDAHGRRFH
jgi:hypothetical protein